MNSAQAERGFSALKWLKNHLRNSLKQEHLDQIMEVFFNLRKQSLSPEEQDAHDRKTIQAALEVWYSMKERRMTFHRKDVPLVSGKAGVHFTTLDFGTNVNTKAQTLEGLQLRRRNRIANKQKRFVFLDKESGAAPEPGAAGAALFSDVGRRAWPELGDMTPLLNDHVAHYYTDLGEGQPGWAAGKIRSLTKSGRGSKRKYTFTVYFAVDGLNQHNTELNEKQYGLDTAKGQVWVFLKITDPAQYKAYTAPPTETLAQLFAESSSGESDSDDFPVTPLSSSGSSSCIDSEEERASTAELEAQVKQAMADVGADAMGKTCKFVELLAAVALQDDAGEMNWNRYDLLHVLTGMSKAMPPKVTIVDGSTPGQETIIALTLFD